MIFNIGDVLFVYAVGYKEVYFTIASGKVLV